MPVIFIFFSLLFSSNALFACATCMVGDPTLTLMGAEKSFTGRLRFSMDYLHREERIGIAGFNQTQLIEQRITVGASYAIDEALNLAIRIPLVDKQLEYANLATQSNRDVGDVELTAKYTLSADHSGGHRHLYGFIMGLRVPTAQEEKDIFGKSVDIDVQAGTGAFVPQVGVWYGYYRYPYFGYASAVAHYAFEGFEDFTAGEALVMTLAGQYALDYSFAVQAAIEARWSGKNKFGEEEDPNSGGFIAFLSPKIMYYLTTDLIINLGLQIPVLKQLNGEQEEEVIIQLGIVYDF